MGLLVEARFPGAAVVHGDITRREGDRARKALAALFGEPFELPVVMDGARLRALIPEDTPGLDKFVDSHRAYRSEAEARALLAKFGFEFLEPSLEDDLERNALICTDAHKLGSKARAALENLADELAERSFWLEFGARPRRAMLSRQEMLQEIAKGTDRMGLRLTEMAWDDILACDDEAELRLVWLLSMSDADKRIPRFLARATFENRALRRFMLSYQRSKSAAWTR